MATTSTPAPLRKIVVDGNESNSNPLKDNLIITSKYTIYNFVPLFLLLNLNPYNKFANFYFLVIGALQCISSISLTAGLPTTLLPLSFVLLVEAIRELREDGVRKKADSFANSTKTFIFNKQSKSFDERQWKDIKLGDIVKVMDNELIPADMMFLYSGAPNRPRSGYVNTKNLDGETDNKYRQAPQITAGSAGFPKLHLEANIPTLEATVMYENPNSNTSDFSGMFEITNKKFLRSDEESTIRIDSNCMFLRGCQLKNTEWIYGLVLNTGPDCKIEFNEDKSVNKCFGNKGTTKGSSINKVLNKAIILLFLVLLLSSIGTSIAYCLYPVAGEWYLDQPALSNADYVKNAFETFGRYILLDYTIIPISLYVSMSLVYGMQAFVMVASAADYFQRVRKAENKTPQNGDEEEKPLLVRTNTLNDELGQVTHVFSDKTGTLTKNLMVFKKAIINGVCFGLDEDEVGTKSNFPPLPNGLSQFCDFIDSNNGSSLKSNLNKTSPSFPKIYSFFLNMALNHSIDIKVKQNGDLNVNASSPDEQAFVAAAYTFGFKFISRDLESGLVVLEIDNVKKEFITLAILEYTNSRKRMSIVMKSLDETKQIFLFSKGADNVMLDRIDRKMNDPEMVKKTEAQVTNWANAALRTLVFAFRSVSQDEFDIWMHKYTAAINDTNTMDLRKRGLENEVDNLMNQLETNLILQGSSAVVDQLQDGVPDTLGKLCEAGIKCWMITGDKVGTAKNIAVSCMLLKDSSQMDVLDLTTEDIDEYFTSTPGYNSLKDLNLRDFLVNAEKVIKKDLNNNSPSKVSSEENTGLLQKGIAEMETKYIGLERARVLLETQLEKFNKNTQILPLCLIIDEKMIDYILCCFKWQLLNVSEKCSSVVCARARKDQKAKMTLLIKENVPTSVTLSIGDGANDVEMIKAAHIGVGINGKEGKQAVNNSDYAISEFRVLLPLLLHYGKNNYRRMSYLVYFIFWKMALLAVSEYIYTLLANNSGQKLFPESGIQGYSVLFTSLPILFYALFDQDLPCAISVLFPKLYEPGLKKKYMSEGQFLLWLLYGLLSCIFLVFIPAYAGVHLSGYHGGDPGLIDLGVLVYTAVIFMASLQCLFQSNLYSFALGFIYVLSIGGWLCWIVIMSSVVIISSDINFLHISAYFFANPSVYIILIWISLTQFLLVKAHTWYQRYFEVSYTHIIQEKYLLGNLTDSGLSASNSNKRLSDQSSTQVLVEMSNIKKT